MALKRITAPAAEPVTLAEAKAQCRVEDTASDALITALIIAARELAEHETGRSLMTQTWELALDAFPAGEIDLIKVPAQSITSIKYFDGAAIEQTISGANYALDSYGIRHWAIPASGFSWPSTLDSANAVKVRFVAGYADAASVPQSVKHWILIHVAYWFANREAAVDKKLEPLPFLGALLDPLRVHFV